MSLSQKKSKEICSFVCSKWIGWTMTQLPNFTWESLNRLRRIWKETDIKLVISLEHQVIIDVLQYLNVCSRLYFLGGDDRDESFKILNLSAIVASYENEDKEFLHNIVIAKKSWLILTKKWSINPWNITTNLLKIAIAL